MIISKTPLRISLMGGGTDIANYYTNNKFGCVISSSIASYIYVIVKKQSEIFSEKFRLNYSETEMISDINEIKNPIIKECLKFLQIDEKIYIATIADIPASTGLGSSSSFCVGLLNALYQFKGQSISQMQLAADASTIEINLLKKPIGKQDQYAAGIGGLNFIKFNSDHTTEVQPINISKKNITLLNENIIIFWSGLTRSADNILSEQSKNYKDNYKNLNILKKNVFSLKDCLELETINLDLIGSLLNESWNLKKTFASKITNPIIDKAYSLAMKNGAIGGKLLGAGGGGFLFFISNPSNHNIIESKLKEIGFTKINLKFSSHGTSVKNLF